MHDGSTPEIRTKPGLDALPSAPVGVLLVNTGTPRSAEVADVRAYLRQFLSDPRVIDIHPVARWLLLHLVILPFRPAKSAAAYRAIWTPQGSPLLVNGRAFAANLQAALGPSAQVRVAMQFGVPSIPEALEGFAASGIDRIIVVPLFPQYAAASTGSAVAAVQAAASARWVVPQLHVIGAFWHEPAFLDAVAVQAQVALDAGPADHILFSYHGLPERHCRRTDATASHCLQRPDCCDALVQANRHCYRAQCFATSRALIARLGLDPAQVTTCFQSRLGRTPWIRPYTDEVLAEKGRAGVKRLVVVEPSFVADCLETLEEIGIRGRDAFAAAGGGALVLAAAPNADAAWASGMAALLRRSCGWLTKDAR